jgi:hypothetical protein
MDKDAVGKGTLMTNLAPSAGFMNEEADGGSKFRPLIIVVAFGSHSRNEPPPPQPGR